MVRKDIVVFGAGKYFENYMLCYGADEQRCPIFVVDNNKELVGSIRFGIEIHEPKSLQELDKDFFYVIICSAQWENIAEQLEQMGIHDYQYYKPVPIETAVPVTLSEEGLVTEVCQIDKEYKPYKIGYVPGVFDLFHVGHLNLLRNAKSRCEYLIAGVLTDELVKHFKDKKPVIPYEQRVAIVEAVRYVDRVVPVDFTNTRKIDAWYRYHYDCHFSGNDHGADWVEDLRQLREVGATMEFFDYTKVISSSALKKQMKQDDLLLP